MNTYLSRSELDVAISSEIRAVASQQQVSFTKLANTLGLSRQGLYLKLKARTAFLPGELAVLGEIFNIPASELTARAEAALAATKTKGGEDK